MTKQDNLAVSVLKVAEAWKDSPYYNDAERWTGIFWNPESDFRKYFSELDLGSVVELACGHGRHAEQIASQCGSITLVDIHQENIDFCRKRLRNISNAKFLKNSGSDLSDIAENSVTSVFCYDAMVHFSADIISSYMKDIHRVLIPGGRVLLHHSNFNKPNTVDYGVNPHARNHMTFDLMSSIAVTASMRILKSHSREWGGMADLDRVTLLEKQ